MEILEQNKKGQDAVKALDKFFKDYFGMFRNRLTEKVVKWSSYLKMGEICKDINLYMILSFENAVSNSAKEKEYYLVNENGVANQLKEVTQIEEVTQLEEVDQNSAEERLKRNINEPMESRIVENITLTNTDFSNYFRNPKQVEWIVTYSGNKNVHRFAARVILNILERSIRELSVLKNSEEYIEKYMGKFDFIDVYIEEMRKCYKRIPNVNLITAVLQEPYEGRKSFGTIYFVNDIEHVKKERTQLVRFTKGNSFKVSFEPKNVQSIRKLLEICSGTGNSLVVLPGEQTELVSGIVSDEVEVEEKEGFSIGFYGNQWEINCGEEMLLKYQRGSYHINFEDEENSIEEKCQKMGIEYATFGKLFQMLKDKAVHGALVIIAEDAKSEVHRLCEKYGRGVAIEELAIDDNDEVYQLILGLTNVDGAVFFDYDGNCYGFSVILDGEAKVRGKKGRGARYNSAINYIADPDRRRCAVVRSEDREKGFTIISAQQAWERFSI